MSEHAPGLILLVDDNPDDAHLTTLEFEDAGITNELAVVHDGSAALDYLRGEGAYAGLPRPGLVLLDLHLPGIEGHEVVREAAGDDRCRDIPIVIMSAPTELGWARSQLGDLLAGTVAKPVDAASLTAVVAGIAGLGADFLARG